MANFSTCPAGMILTNSSGALSQSILLSHFSQTACPWNRFPPQEEQLQKANEYDVYR